MYRIKDDKRVRLSAELICDGLKQCLQNKSIADISVIEVASVSGVGRSTFYRLFDAPVDVLTYMCDSMVSEMMSSGMHPDKNDSDAWNLHFLKFMMDHSDILESVLRSGRPDILYRAFSVLREAHSALDSRLDDKELEYLNASFAAVMCSILYVWNRTGKTETARDLLDIFRKFPSI